MGNENLKLTHEALEGIDFKGEVSEILPFGGGLINDTFLVVTRNGKEKVNKYILQRINHLIFKEVDKLMDNYIKICDYLKNVVKDRGGDVSRQTLTVVPTKEGKSYFVDSNGNYWRAIDYIHGTVTYEVIEAVDDFYKTGKAFGEFQNMLSEYDAKTLHESIPNFHNTKERFKTFLKAVEENKSGRRELVKDEIDFILNRQADTGALLDLLENGDIPLRVTHNDTKISNVLLDEKTKEGICVIDLDTIMPGLSLYDFGDAIRSGATRSKEDEEDLTKVFVDLELFEGFTKGFIEGAADGLNPKEIKMLPMGAKVITLEQGIRFLTDYLDGDLYYKTTFENQNLVRTRTQLKLVEDMENKWDELIGIVNKYFNN